MSKPLCFIAALSFLFLMNRYADAYSPMCSTTSRCGNGSIPIRYPFWVDNNTIQGYCGYPAFRLTCSDDGRPIINLPTDSYYVTDINYYAYTLTLVDIDVVNQSCPRARHNVNLGDLPLSYNQDDVYLSFYFNCTVSNVNTLNPIGCLKNEVSKQSYVNLTETRTETDGYEWAIDCEEKVVVVVKREEIISGDDELVNGFGKAMQNGFVLDWGKARDCLDCENSEGYCGYNQTTRQMLCFCKDGRISTNKSCNKGTFAFS